jgi:hypothetical protein
MHPPPCEHPFESNRLNGAADFRLDWDVESVGHAASAALNHDIATVRTRPGPDPARKIHLLRGAAGYGKTHLFGRVQAEQGERMQFAFIAAPPDPDQPTRYVCWQVVETIFHSTGGAVPPLRRLMARFLRPSFAAYFDQLPAGLRAQSTEIRQALEDDALPVLEVTSRVADLAAFHALADSFRQRFPDLAGGIMRALVLGLSPAADDARAWLRGEADQVPEERLRALRLGDNSPEPGDVIRVVATLLSHVSVPLVLCLDQLDQLYLGSAAGFQELAGQLMRWLQAVPNLVAVLGCVDEQWRQIGEEARLTAFVHRVKVHELGPLTPSEARDLVCRRVRSWEDFHPRRGEGWPFDLASVEKFAQRLPTSPRGFIDRCRVAFDEWRAGGMKGLISLEATGPSKDTLPELFLQEWNKQLAVTRQTLKAAADYQDAELWAGVAEGLRVAQLGQHVPAGVTFERSLPQALRKSDTDPRHSAVLHLGAGELRVPVVVAVSKKDAGQAFAAWEKALEDAVGGDVAGAVAVWPHTQLAVGKKTHGYTRYQALVAAGKVRPFPLDANEDSFAQLECLRRLTQDAAAGNVILDGQTLTADDCRKLVAETRLLANLKLFEFLFGGWPALKAAPAQAAASAATAAAPPAPATPPPGLPRPVATLPATQPQTAVKPSHPAVATATGPTEPPPATPPRGNAWADEMLAKVVEKLRARGQPVRPLGVEVGPTFARLKVEPKDDTDFAKVKRQADNLKLQLGVENRPLIAAQAGYISIDVQRPDRQVVPLGPLLPTRPAGFVGQPAFPVGVDVAGRPHWLSLAEPASCHLLVAGTTGSGKSQLLKALIAALASHLGPDQLQFVLIDPKQVTFGLAGQSPYLRRPVVFDAAEALPLVEECYQEMERRYALLHARGREHVGDLAGADAVPRWVLVFDEFADLMADRASKKELEVLLKRLGAKARAAGIHLVLGTQRPEASVVTPVLRANLPARIGLQVPTERDSKIIIDEPDAAHLLDRGDLFWRRGGSLVRLQSPFVTREELAGSLRLH